MSKSLLKRVEKDLYEEAKRLVPILYDENKLIFFEGDKLKKEIKDLYSEFYIEIQLILIKLCELKFEGKDFATKEADINELYNDYMNLIDFRNSYSNNDINEITNNIKNQINTKDYSDNIVYKIIPDLVKKFTNNHYDCVDIILIYILL